jgi:hypothetical protein
MFRSVVLSFVQPNKIQVFMMVKFAKIQTAYYMVAATGALSEFSETINNIAHLILRNINQIN